MWHANNSAHVLMGGDDKNAQQLQQYDAAWCLVKLLQMHMFWMELLLNAQNLTSKFSTGFVLVEVND